MSDQKNISPLLDDFSLGAPISEHHGVVCYPAIKENTNKKYIVKVISIPASQTQFDAMLLSGAYKDPGDAMEYFRQNGEEILREAEVLKDLSKIEGFLPYDGWQMEPIPRRRLGYEVYLVGSYKRSLEKHMKKNAVTHLEAINLALDLCSALSVCRQSGYLYVDLKPSNIYVSGKKEYRIGDLGFLRLDSLRYASLPERYFSPYTPPELMDPMSQMNLSVDIYAVGMILYQLYNDGQLPFTGLVPPGELSTPCQADYEMAEIIMKAIHPDPDQRWTDPKEFGKAIASYMQRNSVNDIPITQFVTPESSPEDIIPAASEAPADTKTESLQPLSADPASAEKELPLCGDDEKQPDNPVEKDDSAATQEKFDTVSDEESAESQDPSEPHTSEALPENKDEEESLPVSSVSSCDMIQENSESEEITDLQEISEEVSKIISKADDIIAHEIPEEAVFPREPEQPDPFSFATEDAEELDMTLPEDLRSEEEPTTEKTGKRKHTKHYEDPSRKNKLKKVFSGFLSLLLLCGCGFGGYWYYKNAYLQTIDAMTIQGTQDQITVLVDTDVEESRLTVSCMDGKGKTISEPLKGGKATFTDLQPYTQYTIHVDMEGFHKLIGKTSDVITTDAPTQILSFHAIAGSEDGSVKLNFTVDGDEPDFWNIRYAAEGEEPKLETVTGHSAMITGLSVGKVYTFTLDGGNHFALSGETSLQYLASRLILAENLRVTSSTGTDITVLWDTPGDVVVENWDIRFYDGYGFEEKLTVTENQVLFTGIDPATDYTVEITAAGMTQPSRISITADPVNVAEFEIEENSKTEMEISWEYSGNAPEDGWLLLYTVDGSGSQVIQCEKSHAEITPLIPGANYHLSLETADGRTVFNNTVHYQTKDPELFTEHNFKTENLTVNLLQTPESTDWHFETISSESFTNTFAVGDSASMILQNSSTFYLPGYKTKVLFVFRDAYGNVLPELAQEISCQWNKIWDHGDKTIGEINIPKLPSYPGSFIMELYFNGAFVAETELTVTQ